MFNDLNNANNQNHQEVDDIFADTDSAKEPVSNNSGIETRRVGLNSNSAVAEAPVEKAGSGKILKIVLILVVVSIVGLGGYLVYSKLLNNGSAKVTTDSNLVTPSSSSANNNPSTNSSTDNSANSEDTGSVVTPTSEQTTPDDSLANASSSLPASDIPLIPGVNAPAESTATDTPGALLNVDSDLDGVSDAEEKTVGSNPNVIDSDNDNLSDYEEIRIYKTNPIVADTDGDGYLDGAEVKSGYDPNVKGAKMPGVIVP
jgi:hypothetical protein